MFDFAAGFQWIMGGIVLFALGLTIVKVPVIGWVASGVVLMALNFQLGSMWVVVLPGAVAHQEIYAPIELGWSVQFFFGIFQVMLFSGILFRGAVDTFSERVYIVLGIATTVSDVFANTIPWVLGNQVRASTLFVDMGAWLNRSLNITRPDYVVGDTIGFWIVIVFALIIAVGGEVAIARVIRAYMKP